MTKNQFPKAKDSKHVIGFWKNPSKNKSFSESDLKDLLKELKEKRKCNEFWHHLKHPKHNCKTEAKDCDFIIKLKDIEQSFKKRGVE